MIGVLVISGSAIDRRVLAQRLSGERDLRVVGSAADGRAAHELLYRVKPDVVVLDLDISGFDGVGFVEILMQRMPTPVVAVVSAGSAGSEKAIRVLDAGAVEVIERPESAKPDTGRDRIAAAVRNATGAHVDARLDTHEAAAVPEADPVRLAGRIAAGTLIGIGASTGGTVAIETIVESLPAECPPLVICQHMPAAFSAAFAQRLDRITDLDVVEVDESVRLGPGIVAVARGDRHLAVTRGYEGLVAVSKDGPTLHHQKPAVDILFRSIAWACGRNAVGVLLTGMGRDGAQGLLEMREAGAHTIAQDEETSVVYGMPREAVALGAVDEVVPLGGIAAAICRAVAGGDQHGCLRAATEAAATHGPPPSPPTPH